MIVYTKDAKEKFRILKASIEDCFKKEGNIIK